LTVSMLSVLRSATLRKAMGNTGGALFFSTAAAAVAGAKGSFLLSKDDSASIAATVFSTIEGNAKPSSSETVGRELIKQRNSQVGPNVSVFYKQDGGLVVTKGKGVHMIDVDGNKYLDCCNNVASVGHAHPTVVKAGCDELKNIQTNGRFLHPTQQRYLAKLLATFPPELNTVYMVNSGSEANDLALRIARSHTKAKNPKDVIVLDSAYHGHTQAIFEISPYKWSQAIDGKNYHPSTTHVVSCPDGYRGKHRGRTAKVGKAYAKEVEKVVNKTGGVGTFIAESIVGCGGQVMLPPTYLQHCYAAVRAAGGVCIADEVQTGFGRAGSHFWTFQEYDVIPDIVTVGKPMGNGYPVAAVICRRELADSFASSGIEYFNTYGGNSVACAIAEAVLDTIQKEGLQENCLSVGNYIQKHLTPLMKKYEWIGDVRGVGLFQGVEFVHSNKADDPQPYPELTKFVVDFLRYEKIIISRDGPDENVIKIKPPMVFSKANAKTLIDGIDRALQAAVDAKRF